MAGVCKLAQGLFLYKMELRRSFIFFNGSKYQKKNNISHVKLYKIPISVCIKFFFGTTPIPYVLPTTALALK